MRRVVDVPVGGFVHHKSGSIDGPSIEERVGDVFPSDVDVDDSFLPP